MISTQYARFELAARHKGKLIYVYEMQVGRKVYFVCSVQGKMLGVLDPVRNNAIRQAKDFIDALADENTVRAKREQLDRRYYERSGGDQ